MTKLRLPKPTVSNAHFHGCYLGSLYSAEKLRKFAEKAVLAERKACAKVCEEYQDPCAGNAMADEIRARGKV